MGMQLEPVLQVTVSYLQFSRINAQIKLTAIITIIFFSRIAGVGR